MDVYEAISIDQFLHNAWGSHSDCGGGGAQAMSAGGRGEPDVQLRWCHGCGDWVARLYEDDLCILCEEVDARMDAHVGAAMEDYAERAIGVVLDYLHPEDVQRVIARILEDRGGTGEEIRRLRERFGRSQAFVDERARRAREREAEREAPARHEGRLQERADEPRDE